MLIDRKIFIKEIKHMLNERQQLTEIIKKIIKEEVDDAPHKSTGINALKDLLEKIVPVLEDEYKALTSEIEQRNSFRAHIINAVQNTLAPSEAVIDDVRLDEAAFAEFDPFSINPIEEAKETKLEEGDIDIVVGEQDPMLGVDDDKFIDVDGDGRLTKKDQELMAKEESFAIPGEDETGRNFAMKAFEKVEKQIIEAYEVLADDKDREIFYDYLITNLKLYFDKFEDELHSNLPEPTTEEYEAEKDKLNNKEALKENYILELVEY
jgi:hypothetical protein